MKKVLLFLVILLLSIYLIYMNFNRVITVSNFNDYQLESNGNIFELELMTYNIHHGVGIDGKLDLQRISSVIEKSGADIIGLNEVDLVRKRTAYNNQVSYLAKNLDMNYTYGPSKKSYPGSYGNAILSKYPIINTENYPLPIINKDMGETRSLLKAEIEISRDKTIYVLLTHLSLDKDERKKQVKWIDDFIKDLSKPYILMGDFNADLSEILNYLDCDSNRMIPMIRGVKTYPASNPISDIDLFFSDAQLELVEGYSIKSNASDHLPVYVKYRLNKSDF